MKPQTGYARSHHSTLLIENLGNACRKASSAAASRHIGNAHIWHTCVLGSQTCAEFDRAPTGPTQGGRLAGSKADLKNLFAYADKNCSVTEEMFKTLTSPRPAWPTHSPANFRLQSMATLCLEACGGQWKRVKTCFQSLLASPGSLLTNVDTQHVYVVMRVTVWGLLGWRVTVGKMSRGGLTPESRGALTPESRKGLTPESRGGLIPES